jgi:hypothetical protein
MSALRYEDLDDRREPRWQLRLPVTVRTPDLDRRPAVLIELSTLGCRLELATLSAPGAMFLLSLPGLAPRAARLAWTDGYCSGFAFEAPLHIAVVDHLVRTNPA